MVLREMMKNKSEIRDFRDETIDRLGILEYIKTRLFVDNVC